MSRVDTYTKARDKLEAASGISKAIPSGKSLKGITRSELEDFVGTSADIVWNGTAPTSNKVLTASSYSLEVTQTLVSFNVEIRGNSRCSMTNNFTRAWVLEDDLDRIRNQSSYNFVPSIPVWANSSGTTPFQNGYLRIVVHLGTNDDRVLNIVNGSAVSYSMCN